MYITSLRLWNFRKFEERADADGNTVPGLIVDFQKGLNLLVGENDSGKTAVIDALRILLNTRSSEYVRITPDDFSNDTSTLRLECDIYFDDEEGEAKDKTASQFVELLSYDDKDEPFLKLTIVADKDRPLVKRRFGDSGLTSGDEDRLDLIKAIYLRPLRDATAMLKPGYNSRVTDVLTALKDFKEVKDKELEGESAKELKRLFNELKQHIEAALSKGDDSPNKMIIAALEKLLLEGTDLAKHAKFSPRIQDNIASILALFELLFDKKSYKLPGLGHMNILVIALELMLLSDSQDFPYKSMRCCLVEELEAHLHPQLQLNVIKYLEEADRPQVIATTHSPNLVSNAPLESIIYLNDQTAFSVGRDSQLKPYDKTYLRRFLDVTKANVFFARALIITEGYSDAVLISALAKAQGKDLVGNGVSIIVAGARARGLTRFASLFLSNGAKPSPHIKIALAGDKDAAIDERSPLYSSYGQMVPKAEDRNRIGCFLSPSQNLEACYFSEKEFLLQHVLENGKLHKFLEGAADLKTFLKKVEKQKTALADELADTISDKPGVLGGIESLSHLTGAINFVLSKEEPD